MAVLKENILIFRKKCICDAVLKAGWPWTCSPNVLGSQVWTASIKYSYIFEIIQCSFSFPVPQESIFNTYAHDVFEATAFLLTSQLVQQLPYLRLHSGTKLFIFFLNLIPTVQHILMLWRMWSFIQGISVSQSPTLHFSPFVHLTWSYLSIVIKYFLLYY